MNNFLMQTQKFFKKNASTILTCVGGVGVVATAVLAVKATPKVMDLLEKAEEEKGEKLTKLEIVKVAAPSYIPAVTIGVSTIACVFGANALNKRQQAALMSAYALVDNSYKEYKNKLKELYGEETHQKIVDSIAAEKAEKMYIHSECFASSCDLHTDENASDPVLFYDEYSKRFFEATIEQVINAEYHLNRNFVLRGVVPLNEFYEFLGLEPTECGSRVGWAVDDELYWIDFNHRKAFIDDGLNSELECYIIETPWGPSAEHMDDYWG